MSANQFTKYALTPVAVGLVSGAAAMAWRPGQNVVIGDKTVPLSLVIAGASAAATLLSELVNSYVFENLPEPLTAIGYPVHTALNIGVQTATICGIENYLSPGLVGDQGVLEVAGICGLGFITGKYVATEWLAPWYGQMTGSY